jgi:hypothetical protein
MRLLGTTQLLFVGTNDWLNKIVSFLENLKLLVFDFKNFEHRRGIFADFDRKIEKLVEQGPELVAVVFSILMQLINEPIYPHKTRFADAKFLLFIVDFFAQPQ